MKPAMRAIIQKDFRSIVTNKRYFSAILIVPIILTMVFPSIFVVCVHFVPDDPDVVKLLELLPPSARWESLELTVINLVLNYIMPIFFLMIPIMTASIMAASAFVGEKERHTLETLLYCPLTLKQIFQAKVLSAFLLSMLVSFISFCSMLLVLEAELFFLMGQFNTAKRQLGDHYAAGIPRHFPYRSNADRQRVRQSQKCGRITTGRCLSHHPHPAFDRGAVFRNPSAEPLDSAWLRRAMRCFGRAPAEKIHGPFYL